MFFYYLRRNTILKNRFKKNTKSFKAFYFCYMFNDDFISYLYYLFIFFFDNKRIQRKLRNRLNNNAKINYFCFNIFINEDKTKINNIKQIKKLRRYIQL